MKVHALLKQASATASEHATEDQASDHATQSSPSKVEFELEIAENPPTTDQVRSILEYVGAQRAGEIIKGAKDDADAMKKLSESSSNFNYPVVVDWNNGRAVAGENESEIMKLLESLPKN